jgi:hypothetical protein
LIGFLELFTTALAKVNRNYLIFNPFEIECNPHPKGSGATPEAI